MLLSLDRPWWDSMGNGKKKEPETFPGPRLFL